METIGGVAHNVFTAAHLYLNSSPSAFLSNLTPKTRLISSVALDLSGKWVLESLKNRGIDTSGIEVCGTEKAATARYIALNDAKGGLFTAAADMRIIEAIQDRGHLSTEIKRAKPRWVCMDGNLSMEGIKMVVNYAKKVGAKVAFEPTSTQKSTRLFFPPTPPFSHLIHLTTPNHYELSSMYTHAKSQGYFDTSSWFTVIDSLNITSTFRNSISVMAQNVGIPLVEMGTVQQAIQLSPYIPVQVVKLGEQGCMVVVLLPGGGRAGSSGRIPDGAIISKGLGPTNGIWIKHFPPVEKVPEAEAVSVNGVGDTFLGVLLGRIVEDEIRREERNVGRDLGNEEMDEGGWIWEVLDGLEEAVGVAQRGAVQTLRSREAVGEGVGKLR